MREFPYLVVVVVVFYIVINVLYFDRDPFILIDRGINFLLFLLSIYLIYYSTSNKH
jgi:hypothetical protein